MKAEELRIGNYVKNQDGTLTGTPIGKPIKLTLDDFDKWLGFYVPIPLTTDRLLKFGFVSNNNFGGRGFKKGNMILFLVRYSSLFDEKKDFGFEIEYCAGNNFDDRTNIVRRIDFVHQLQNLYFALTEEELTL